MEGVELNWVKVDNESPWWLIDLKSISKLVYFSTHEKSFKWKEKATLSKGMRCRSGEITPIVGATTFSITINKVRH